MDWKNIKKTDEEGLKIPHRWLLLHYYEALNILFRAENSQRVFVYIILKNEFLEKWNDSEVPKSDGTRKEKIAEIASKRISQAQGFGYLGYDIKSPLLYLNSGELVHLIISEQYWNIFESYFKGKKEIIKNKLDEINSVRNSLAHFRPIKYDDIELIKQNIKHTFMGIEKLLNEMTNIFTVVPTNTADEWYINLNNLASDTTQVQLFQSENQEWIRVHFDFHCKIIETKEWWKGFINYKVLNIDPAAILCEFENIRKYVTYSYELVPYNPVDDNNNLIFRKHVSFIFNKDVLSCNLENIYEAFKKVIKTIDMESELIAEDNLAKGKLISTGRATAELKKENDKEVWHTNSNELKKIFSENDPVEYWGDFSNISSDFIAGIDQYPWMPSNISNSRTYLD